MKVEGATAPSALLAQPPLRLCKDNKLCMNAINMQHTHFLNFTLIVCHYKLYSVEFYF